MSLKNAKSKALDIHPCAANESGMMIQTYVQDCILFKYTVYLAPSSVILWSVLFLDVQF